MLTVPVWCFWSAVWIWPSFNNRVFKVKESNYTSPSPSSAASSVESSKSLALSDNVPVKDDAVFIESDEEKEDPRVPKPANEGDWVYVDETVAKSHKYYGAGGWAVLLLLGLFVSPIRILADFYKESINLSEFDHINGFAALYYAEAATNWLLAGACLIAAFMLIAGNKNFPKMYITIFLLGIVIPIVDAFAVIAVFENSGLYLNFTDILPPEEIGKHIGSTLVGFIWVLYVLFSKRINITTQHRLKYKHRSLLFCHPLDMSKPVSA
jgi:hypothetical protein